MPPMPLPEGVAGSFAKQEKSCERLGSPFTAALCGLITAKGLPHGPVHDRLAGWSGNLAPVGDALPLRLTGALHSLVLEGRDPELAAVYPPTEAAKDVLAEAVFGAVTRHGEFIAQFLDSPPQTNETARSAVLLPAFLWLAKRCGLPLAVSEIGSSAGLNQNWHRYRYDYGSWTWGDENSPVVLPCEWRGGTPPAPVPVTVAESAGCDIAPIPIDREEDRLRLRSYVWADQTTRLDRLNGALRIAKDFPPQVETADAGRFLAGRLNMPRTGHLHVIFHTIMWQYMPAAEQGAVAALIKDAGTRATAYAPLAWLRFEPDGKPDGAALSVTLWNGDSADGETLPLGRGDYHGRWIDWAPAG
ncbi:DUF2332 domain-containing protein [Oricola indica]|jgi:hypothetical protein|uniref:DUF2332 domain-containing protein n=1 Tax=Oricola indica TaxID=2872591 RepID=UPI001CBFF4A5|nr:DUF2332 family protein [Oricola indica]